MAPEYPILECRGCGHGWHAVACEGITITRASTYVRCPCAGTPSPVPSPTEYLAGARNATLGSGS